MRKMSDKSLLQKAAETLKARVNDYEFKIGVRQTPADFSRKGKLGFTNTILLALNYCARTLQIEINNYFELIGKPENTVTRPAYLEARGKLKTKAFSVLLDGTIELTTLEHKLLKRLKGYRVFAIDGSKITLENTTALRKQYGVSGGEHGTAAARLSTMVDVINADIIMDVQFTRYSVGERESAARHHERLTELGIAENSILIYDRGYASAEMISDLNSRNIKYIYRLKKGWNVKIDKLLVGTDTTMAICPNGIPLIARVVKFELESGETETLLVSPELSAELFPLSEMKNIYFMRWGIETNYRVLKSLLQIENFTGPSSLYIEQDVYATALLLNLTAFAKLESDELIEKRNDQKKQI
jgi:hypothetical protein